MQVTRSLNVGGLERIVSCLARRIDTNRFEPSVCCLLRKGFFTPELEAAGIPVHVIPEDARGRTRKSIMALAKLLKRERIDAIHTHNTHPFVEGAIAASLARTPIRIHTDHSRAFPDHQRYMIAERLVSHLVDRVVAVSQHSRNDLIEFEHISPRKIDVIANGVDMRPEPFDVAELKATLGLADNWPIAISVSRLTEQKGTHYFVDAMPAVLAQYPRAKFLIVGDGELRPELEQQAAALGIESAVEFFGYRKDVPRFLAVSDIFVSSSIWEGMPLGLLEVMAYGKPIVGASVGGVPEVIRDGSTGFLVPPRSPQAIAGKILGLASDRDLAARMGASAQALYYEKFTEKSMVGNYEQLVLRLAKAKRLI